MIAAKTHTEEKTMTSSKTARRVTFGKMEATSGYHEDGADQDVLVEGIATGVIEKHVAPTLYGSHVATCYRAESWADGASSRFEVADYPSARSAHAAAKAWARTNAAPPSAGRIAIELGKAAGRLSHLGERVQHLRPVAQSKALDDLTELIAEVSRLQALLQQTIEQTEG